MNRKILRDNTLEHIKRAKRELSRMERALKADDVETAYISSEELETEVRRLRGMIYAAGKRPA